MFQNLFKNAVMFKEKIIQDVGDRIALSEQFGCLWEPSENIEKCRGCSAKFQLPLLKRKHHCRVCAGVFCDSCCHLPPASSSTEDEPEDDSVKSPDKKTDKKTLKNPDKMTDKKTDKNPKGAMSPGNPTKDALASMRVCDGCKRGETPGEKLRNKIRQQIEHHAEKGLSMQQRREKRAQSTAENQETISALDKFGQFVAVKLGENIGIQFADTPPGQMIKLSRGSAYGEDNQQITTAHKPGCMGYIEILNKSDEFFCVKVLRKGGDQKFEVPRPSYIAVPPNLSVHGFFNKEEEEDVEENNLEIIILCNNPNPTGKNINSLKYDTFLYGDKSKISPCAKIEFFEKVIYYKINSQNSNVLLKYKKDGCLETRNGNSMKRVGVMGMINGSKVVDGKIDYATNISNIETVFSMSC